MYRAILDWLFESVPFSLNGLNWMQYL